MISFGQLHPHGSCWPSTQCFSLDFYSFRFIRLSIIASLGSLFDSDSFSCFISMPVGTTKRWFWSYIVFCRWRRGNFLWLMLKDLKIKNFLLNSEACWHILCRLGGNNHFRGACSQLTWWLWESSLCREIQQRLERDLDSHRVCSFIFSKRGHSVVSPSSDHSSAYKPHKVAYQILILVTSLTKWLLLVPLTPLCLMTYGSNSWCIRVWCLFAWIDTRQLVSWCNPDSYWLWSP